MIAITDIRKKKHGSDKRFLALSRRTGAILLLTLWLGIVLGAVAYSLLYTTRIEMKLASRTRDGLRAYALARAGLAKAIVDIKNDMIIDYAGGSHRFDAEGDIWTQTEDKTDIELGKGTYTVRIEDENARINLNAASDKLLTNLLTVMDYDEDDTREMVNAIIDWRDKDEIARTRPVAEKKYYNNLREERLGDLFNDPSNYYVLKNDLFTTVDELLLVEGMTRQLFGLSVKPEGEDEEDEYPGLRDFLTVYGRGRININTACQEVMAATLKTASPNLGDPMALADNVIKHRRDGRSRDFDNKSAFRTFADIRQVSGMEMILPRIGSLIRIDSDTFRIISTGYVGEGSYTIEAIVQRSWEKFNPDEELVPDRERKRSVSDKTEIFYEPTIRVLEWIEQ